MKSNKFEIKPKLDHVPKETDYQIPHAHFQMAHIIETNETFEKMLGFILKSMEFFPMPYIRKSDYEAIQTIWLGNRDMEELVELIMVAYEREITNK